MRRVLITLVLCGVALERASAADRAEYKDHFEVEANIDIPTSRGGSDDMSATFSPLGRYYESGPRVRLTVAESRYPFWLDLAKTSLARGRDREVDLLFGYAFKMDRWTVMATAGPAFAYSRQWLTEPPLRTDSFRLGTKIVGSVFGNPNDRTLIFGQVYHSTVSNSNYLQAKVGTAIVPKVFLGPEISFASGNGYQQWRVGVFVAGITFRNFLAGVSVGYVNDRSQGPGAYLATSIRTAF